MTGFQIGIFLGMAFYFSAVFLLDRWRHRRRVEKPERVACPVCGECRDAEDLWPWIENNIGRSCRKCGANLAVVAEASKHFKAKRAEQQRVVRLRAEAKAYNEAVEKGDES